MPGIFLGVKFQALVFLGVHNKRAGGRTKTESKDNYWLVPWLLSLLLSLVWLSLEKGDQCSRNTVLQNPDQVKSLHGTLQTSGFHLKPSLPR